MTPFVWRLIETPIGCVRVAWSGAEVVSVETGRQLQAPPPAAARCDPFAEAPVTQQLREYFEGVRQRFDLRLAARGTAFQQRVWRALAGIPFGETRGYAEIARELGRPGAARAVGAASACNPIAIVVPCHRVVGASGTLTGYAGGLEAKARLLGHEGIILEPRASSAWRISACRSRVRS